MQPTDILMEEHQVILQVLECLDRMARQSLAEGRLNEQHAKEAVAFFRNFADQCHHGKEEAHLFPMMEAKGFPRQGGPTGVMIDEHERGRAHVRAMADAIGEAAGGDKAAIQRFARHALDYVQLLRGHIDKEDHCLFPMANGAMDPADQQALLDKFEHVEREEMGAGTHEKYLAIANTLADAYKVPRALVPAHAGCGCTHHKNA